MEVHIDSVQKTLIDFQLVDREAELRNILSTICVGEPSVRDLSIGMVAVLMSCGGIPWPMIMRSVYTLGQITDDELKTDGAVGVVNGKYMVISAPERKSKMVDMQTGTEVSELPPSVTTTVFSVVGAWAQVEKALAD